MTFKQKQYRRRAKLMFNPIILEKACQDIKITDAQKKSAKKWINMIKGGQLEKESKNYERFKETIMIDILGYDRNEVLISGAITGPYPDFIVKGKTGMDLCIEAKGTLSDPFAPQNRKNQAYETPILQATLYKGKGYHNAICTNYREFILVGENDHYHIFDFMDVENEDTEKLREFIKVFSKETIVGDTTYDALIAQSIQMQNDITKKFYTIFHDTRRMMIHSIIEHGGKTQQEAVKEAQMILNRLIFIFYAEDMELLNNDTKKKHLFTNLVVNVIQAGLTLKTKGIWSLINDILFVQFKDGDKDRIINAFNGGLFEREIPDWAGFLDLDPKTHTDEFRKKNLKFWKDKELCETMQEHPDLNPIICNLLQMEHHDFATELGPNLLGHIFEKSMSELEKIGAGGDMSRKKTGAYYTLENVTSYICRNTIISYLGKEGRPTSAAELLYQYAKYGEVDILENKLEAIRILDPSCGSGAFLTKAVDVLLDIHQEIHGYKINQKINQGERNSSIDEFMMEDMSRSIIDKNLFGIDLNPAAVEIAKLSMFFKIALKEKKLPDLSRDITSGNTILGGENTTLPEIDSEKFIEMAKHGGFDIIIGNPPYVESTKADYLQKPHKYKNTYAYFIQKGIDMLKPGGMFGYIVPVSCVSTGKMSKIQNYMLEMFSNMRISNYDDRPGKLFDGLEDCRSSIIIGQKKKKNDKKYSVHTTGYNRWYTDDVGGLFRKLEHVEHDIRTDTYIPKLGSKVEIGIWNKINGNSKISESLKSGGGKQHCIIYHNAPRYWTRGMDFIPYFSRGGKEVTSDHNKLIYAENKEAKIIITGVLNSSLFYWFFIKTSNCRDLTEFVIGDFPINVNWNKNAINEMTAAVKELMSDYKRHSKRTTTNNQKTGIVEYDTFYPKHSKTIIDKIDIILAKHYGMTEVEGEFIRNFDLKFRMGKK